MRTSTLILPALLALAVLHPAAATARNYDCTKPGNANKVACRTTLATPAAAPATPAAAAMPKVATAPAARHYDCSKPGNANKAVCKGAATPAVAAASPSVPAAPVRARVARAAAPTPAVKPARPAAAPVAAGPATASAGSPRIVSWTTKTGKLVHYDCSKAGNFTKKACKQ